MHKGILSGLIFGPIFALIGYFVAFHAGKPILDNARRSTEWPSVPGVVQRSKVATSTSDGKTMYKADVVYKYQVGDRDYQCSTVAFGGDFSSSDSSWAHAVRDKYPAGSEVEVFYQPEEPANAVLEPGATWKSYMVFGIGMVFLVVGGLVVGSSLLFVVGAVLITGGAVSGLIGRRPQRPGGDSSDFDRGNSYIDRRAGPGDAAESPDSRRPSTIDDDGFDIR